MLLVLCFESMAQGGFKITGRLGGTLGDTLVLAGSGPSGLVKLGEAVMVNGSFEFAGNVSGVQPAYILTSKQEPIVTIMLENAEYAIVAGESGIEVQGGGEAQRVWADFDNLNRSMAMEKMKLEQEARAAYSEQNQMKLQALQQQAGKMMERAGVKQAELLQKHKDSFVTAFVIASGMQQSDKASLQGAYDILGESARASLYGQLIARQLKEFERVEPGAEVVDFAGIDAKGDTVSLYKVNARVKLVDFWASWCGPCRQEMPNVKKLYKKYHEKGLEIIGVSLDKKGQDWLKALSEENLPWLNIIDPEGSIAAYYFVRGIPHTVLLDGNNRVIATGLRGKQLEDKIAELLGK